MSSLSLYFRRAVGWIATYVYSWVLPRLRRPAMDAEGGDVRNRCSISTWNRIEDSGWQRVRCDFPDFDDLTTVQSVSFQLFGRSWELKVHPIGVPCRGTDTDNVMVYLILTAGPSIEFSVMMYDKLSSQAHRPDESHLTTTHKLWEVKSQHMGSLLFRLNTSQKLIDSRHEFFLDGLYSISVYMKEIEARSPLFVPTNPCGQGILKIFDDEKTADVAFEVSGESKDDDDAMTTIRINAHRLVLRANAPTLADLCVGNDNLTPVPINNVKPDIFRAVLRYVYGGDVPSKLVKESARDLISASDLYGISSLKVALEVAYINSTPITIENMVDNFYFAESKTCALLKEKVMDFLVEKGVHALNQVSFSDPLQSSTIFHDLMSAMVRNKSDIRDYDGDDTSKFRVMSVDILRRKLNERELEIDGTREMMVTALEASYANDKDS